MRYSHLLAAAVAFTAFAGLAQADQHQTDNAAWKQGIQRTDLTREDLGDSVHEVIQARVDFNPGITSPYHSHPGVEVAYVIQGTFEYRLEGRDPIILKAGESLFIPSGKPHLAINIGKDKASELATYIVKKGSPLLILE